ncbi:MAG: archaeal heat shock protein Hsp20 [Candidatus Thermoplasmatota archaeon]
MATPSKPPSDPWAAFPGGNPFGPGGPFAGGGDPFANLDAWLRQMGVDPADFRRMADEMSRGLQDALRQMGDPSQPNKSFVSGFSVKVGPDGKPTFNTFGNKPTISPVGAAAKPGIAAKGGIPKIVTDEREPLTDVIDSEKEIAITMELPGVEKKDINVHMTDDDLEIGVDNERRKYHKRVKLPAKVDPKTTKATYTNGILDVTVQKRTPGKSGVRIAVE